MTIQTEQPLSLALTILNQTDIKLALTNRSNTALYLYSHVEAEEKHYDFFHIEARSLDGDEMHFSLYESRLKSAPIVKLLAAQDTLLHTINLVHWANKPVNNEELRRAELLSLSDISTLRLRAMYRYIPGSNPAFKQEYPHVWTGSIVSEWAEYRK
ncbi:MAG: hypothetical protein MUF71_08810 [Candidatus Kapabacteria bacterium]|jgi:hypothetical protein|nr:hypothetical protein [Candidatus Kapabacteria bacterium]